MNALKHPVAGLAIYAAVAVALVGGIGVSFAALVNNAVVSQPVAHSKSPLDLRIESAREVRIALAKPIASPEPLPPVTAKVSRPAAKLAHRSTPKPNQQMAMLRARQLFAEMDAPRAEPAPFFGFLAFGR